MIYLRRCSHQTHICFCFLHFVLRRVQMTVIEHVSAGFPVHSASRYGHWVSSTTDPLETWTATRDLTATVPHPHAHRSCIFKHIIETHTSK